ncbi:hypothetical protein ACFWHF_14430 [Streptomyces griseoincarnatus]
MGFQKRRKTYVIEFTDPELEGFEVRMRGLSIGEVLEIQKLEEVSKENLQALNKLLEFTAAHIESWNLEEDGVPVPVSLEELKGLDMPVISALLDGWTKAVSDVPDPLDEPAPSGGTSEAPSIPMELFSVSHAS